MNITQRLAAVSAEVGAVRKADRNEHQRFNFRGIDAVVNAVHPVLTKHQVVVVPEVLSHDYAQLEVGKNRTLSGHCRVLVRFTFHGPEGDSVAAVVAAEAMDSGDKAYPKAMSVALRTALLQVLLLPTDEPDPDASTYERSAPPATTTNLDEIATRIATMDLEGLREVYRVWHRTPQWRDIEPLVNERRAQLDAV